MRRLLSKRRNVNMHAPIDKPANDDMAARELRQLTPGLQSVIVICIAAAALLAGAFFILATSGPSFSEAPANLSSHAKGGLALSPEQLASLKAVKVETQTFFTEIDA